jgi:septal ring factor EnvC (AmiA/AmiB activator)
VVLFGAMLLGAAAPSAHHHHTPPPRSRVAPVQPPKVDPLPDLTGAVPLRDANKLPSTTDQYTALRQEIDQNKPAAETAKRKSDQLNGEAADLRKRLADTTARVQALEDEKGRIDAELARLGPEEQAMAATFVRDRAQVASLLAVLERLQSDMPPVLALKANDALSAARGAMVLGGTLPRIYQAAKELSQRLTALRAKQVELTQHRLASARVGVQLASARTELDQLLAIKSQEAQEATAQYGDLEARLDAAAEQADNLKSLLAKVAALRQRPAGQGIIVVSALNTAGVSPLRRGAIVRPVEGSAIAGGVDGVGGARAPGLTFLSAPGAGVVAPGDGEVLFAGSYHKTGKVLILEMGGGYDLVLAGLERIDVRPGDELLAGEPVGAMPRIGAGTKLYFELRQNGKGVNPAPWMDVDLRKAKRS